MVLHFAGGGRHTSAVHQHALYELKKRRRGSRPFYAPLNDPLDFPLARNEAMAAVYGDVPCGLVRGMAGDRFAGVLLIW